jgi:hypothetical protein
MGRRIGAMPTQLAAMASGTASSSWAVGALLMPIATAVIPVAAVSDGPRIRL